MPRPIQPGLQTERAPVSLSGALPIVADNTDRTDAAVRGGGMGQRNLLTPTTDRFVTKSQKIAKRDP